MPGHSPQAVWFEAPWGLGFRLYRKRGTPAKPDKWQDCLVNNREGYRKRKNQELFQVPGLPLRIVVYCPNGCCQKYGLSLRRAPMIRAVNPAASHGYVIKCCLDANVVLGAARSLQDRCFDPVLRWQARNCKTKAVWLI